MPKYVKISDGNSKIGKIPNLSFPPSKTCKGKECLKDCYAMKSCSRFPNAYDAWNHNYENYIKDPEKFFYKFDSYLEYHDPELFRLFVGGDFPDQDFVDVFYSVAKSHPKTNFLVFTKQYQLDFKRKPDNVTLVLSTWPGVELPDNPHNFPMAWLSEDSRKPNMYLKCPGECELCGNRCWSALNSDIHVVFDKH